MFDAADRAPPEPVITSLSDIMDEFGPGIFRYAARVLGDRAAAEDIRQETFLTLHEKLSSYRSEESLKGFVYGIARNKIAQRKRSLARLWRRHNDYKQLRDQAGPCNCSQESDFAKREALDHCLGKLSQKVRDVVILRHQEGLSATEVAQVLKISEAAVHQRASRAVAQLRVCLKEQKIK